MHLHCYKSGMTALKLVEYCWLYRPTCGGELCLQWVQIGYHENNLLNLYLSKYIHLVTECICQQSCGLFLSPKLCFSLKSVIQTVLKLCSPKSFVSPVKPITLLFTLVNFLQLGVLLLTSVRPGAGPFCALPNDVWTLVHWSQMSCATFCSLHYIRCNKTVMERQNKIGFN